MIAIRSAKSADVDRIYELIVAIADHHDQTRYVRTNPAELLAAGFGDEPSFGVLLAERDAAVVGYVSYTINYSIWRGRKYMNIDDVYVDANCRGRGIGEALMQGAKNHCNKLGITRIRWEVQTENRDAIRFYERLGAKYTEKGIFSWDIPR